VHNLYESVGHQSGISPCIWGARGAVGCEIWGWWNKQSRWIKEESNFASVQYLDFLIEALLLTGLVSLACVVSGIMALLAIKGCRQGHSLFCWSFWDLESGLHGAQYD
jgi:hypothetical protein